MFSIQTSYTQAQADLGKLLDQIEQEDSIAVIQRPGHKDIALLAADELSSLLETVYLLRSPANARQLFSALETSRRWDESEPAPPHSVEALCQELGIER